MKGKGNETQKTCEKYPKKTAFFSKKPFKTQDLTLKNSQYSETLNTYKEA